MIVVAEKTENWYFTRSYTDHHIEIHSVFFTNTRILRE